MVKIEETGAEQSPLEQDDPDRPVTRNERKDPWRRVELKLQFTNRGTPGETSRTTLRLEALFKGLISFLRVDIPGVDKQKDDVFYEGLGDIKARAGFHAILLGDCRLLPFFEMIFPTAEEPELGQGKYQIAPGLRLAVPVTAPWVETFVKASSM